MQITIGAVPKNPIYRSANRTKNDIQYIVIHYTAVEGDTALNNINYFKDTTREASAHFFVDETSIYTSVPVKDIAWHCGTKQKYYHKTCRNTNSIGIELCSIKVNGAWAFKDETVNNAIHLTKYLMNQYEIPISNIVRHYDVTHKNCPAPYVSDINAWNDFKNRVSNLSSPNITGSTNGSSGSGDVTASSTNNVSGNDNSSNGTTGTVSVPLPNVLKTKNLTYITATGDTLPGIAQDFYNDSGLYMTIYNANTDKITDANSELSGGIELTIPYLDSNKFEDIYNERNEERATKNQREFEEQKTYLSKLLHGELNMKNTYSAAFDDRITEILPEEIVSFTLIDSDKNIYNMFEIQIDMPLGLANGLPNQCYQRVVPDYDSILRFGIRSHPVISTNLVSSVGEAEIFGTMMICKSLSKRYSGSLTMIEDSAIKIGNPIRFHIYDEHPFKNTGLFNSLQYPGQAIFYVTDISRSVTPNGVSFMTLKLEAGRVMGQQSIYDQCLPLYGEYYDEYEYSRLELAMIKNQYDIDQASIQYNSDLAAAGSTGNTVVTGDNATGGNTSGGNATGDNYWSGKGEFKSYMDYRKIKDKESPQYKLQQTATTNSDGIREYNGRIMLAIGQGHGFKVGDTFTVTLSTGYSFEAIMGDAKGLAHTDSNGIVHITDGSIIEFIIDEYKLNSTAKKMGDISYVPGGKYKGGVISIK